MENKKKILIIEDEVSLSAALYAKFTSQGFIVFQAKDGEEGLAFALSQHPDLILLDIVMPKMDGITMLKKLRAESDWGKNAKVIILTNLVGMGKIASDLKESNVHEYIIKSDYKIEDIIAKVREVIG